MTDRLVIGYGAAAFSVIYFLSDLLEVWQGGFSSGQLWLTLLSEAAIPFFVVGLYVAQRPPIGRLGLVSAAAYAYAFIYFTYTVIYALTQGIGDYSELSDRLGAPMFIHGAIMVIAGIGFGMAIIRAGVFPRWTGLALMAGVVAVGLFQSAPEGIQLVAAGLRDLAFAGMGIALIRDAGSRPADRWKQVGVQ